MAQIGSGPAPITYNGFGCSASATAYDHDAWETDVSAGVGLDPGSVGNTVNATIGASYGNSDWGGWGSGLSASLSAYYTSQTAGPKRPGVLRVLDFHIGSTTTGGGGGFIAFESAFLGISDGTDEYSTAADNGDGSEGPIGTLPFTLGVPFSYGLRADAEVEGPGYGSDGNVSRLKFQLFEADGVTPVNIMDADPSVPGVPIDGFNVPEASTFGMGLMTMLLGGLVLLATRLRRPLVR